MEARNLIRRMRRALGRSEPYVFVLELHRDGVFHVHVVTRLVMPVEWWESVWGRGMVHPGKGVRGDGLVAAGYASKYVGKALESAAGRHSYEVGEGFAPVVVEGEGESVEDVVMMLGAYLDSELRVLALHDLDDYLGPPAWWVCGRARGQPDA